MLTPIAFYVNFFKENKLFRSLLGKTVKIRRGLAAVNGDPSFNLYMRRTLRVIRGSKALGCRRAKLAKATVLSSSKDGKAQGVG